MNNLKITWLVGLIFFQLHTHAQAYFDQTYPAVWERSTNYTLEVLEAMPEEHYDFKIHEDVFSFKEQAVHLIGNIGYLTGKIEGTKNNFLDGKVTGELTKPELIELLSNAFEYVRTLQQSTGNATLQDIINFNGVDMPKENLFYLIRDHMAHHRGQCILFLRMKGITPPKYVGW